MCIPIKMNNNHNIYSYIVFITYIYKNIFTNRKYKYSFIYKENIKV